MTNWTTTLLALGAVAWGAIAAAAIDTSDIDTLLMQDLDDTAKDLEPLLGAKNTPAAQDAVIFLADGLKWIESYFAAKDAPDAVQFARDGQERAAAVLAAIEGKDFAAAAEAARGLTKSCRACHDVYRP